MKGLLKNIVGAVAPTLGTAIGGPMGGMAANMIADVLGVPNDQKSIEKAIQNATPEQMLELKKAEQQFEVQMKELDVDIYRLETQDVQDAREKFSSDWTPKFLGVLCLVGFFGYIGMVTLYPQPDSSDDIVMLVIGSITGIATAVISFYFGSSNKK